MSFFSDLFGGGYQDAAAAEQAGLNAGYGQATTLDDQSRQALTTNYAAGLAPLTGVQASANAGAGSYASALGIPGSGPGGTNPDPAAIQAQLAATPGYQFNLNQGIQAVDRSSAATSGATSGNQLTALDQFGAGLASNTYQNYVANLQPFLGQQTTNANNIANVDTGLGNALGTSYANQGTLAYNTQAGIGAAQAAADTASQNATNSFLQGGLKLGTQLLGRAIPGAGSIPS